MPALQPAAHFMEAYIWASWNILPSSRSQPPAAVLGVPTISPFWPSGTTGTEIVAWVYDDPETLYDVQYANPGTPGTTSVQTAVGAECDWRVASPGGSTQTGLSNTWLTATQSTSGQFQITGFAYDINDSLTDAYIVVSVRLNEAQYKASVNAV